MRSERHGPLEPLLRPSACVRALTCQFIGYFVDGVVLAYDTPPPPTADEVAGEQEEPTGELAAADEDAGFVMSRGYSVASPTEAGAARRRPKGANGVAPSSCRSCYKRVSPAFSVLTFVVSVDNFVSGLGVLPILDTSVCPAWVYYLGFVVAVFLGGIFTAGVRRINSEGVQAAWFAFGAFSIFDGGMELATHGVTEFVLFGFMIVWCILLMG